MKQKIPDRWIDYRPFHKVIEGTRFLPFKVPLKEQFNRYLDNPNSFFNPKNFIENCSVENIRLGMVIDLTFTTRYYDRQEFENRGIEYKKIFTKGHEIPNPSVLANFRETVNNFINNATSDSVIAVHCTHGVNRTGYILCHYMIHELGMAPQEAMDAFSVGRGYPIERPLYTASLREQRRRDTYNNSNEPPTIGSYPSDHPTTSFNGCYGEELPINRRFRSSEHDGRSRLNESDNSSQFAYSSNDPRSNYQETTPYNYYYDAAPSKSVNRHGHYRERLRHWYHRRNNDKFSRGRNSRNNSTDNP